MPVSNQGYQRPTYDEILAAKIELAKELFGDDIDTSDASAMGKFIRLYATDLADAYEAQEIIYYSRFPNTATGQSLDRLMPFAGISRNPATRAEHKIKFTGTVAYEVPVGFLVGTTTEEEFYLANPVTIGSDGTGEGIVQCTELGVSGNVALGKIAEIVNPDANVSAIQHTSIVTIAEDEETDEELRKRFAVAVKGSGSSTASAIIGAVMRVNNVKSCVIVENTTNSTDSGGRPAHSFEVYVHAPASADQGIGEAIFDKKPIGIPCVGSTTVTVVDSSGQNKTVKFSHVNEVALHIKVTVDKNSHFELDGVSQIKTALLEYVESLGGGDDVIFTRMYKSIFGVTGVVDVSSLSISTDGTTYKSENVTIDQDEAAILDAANITVEVKDYVDT